MEKINFTRKSIKRLSSYNKNKQPESKNIPLDRKTQLTQQNYEVLLIFNQVKKSYYL